MAPSFVLEPTYQALRRRLLAGAWPSGCRLEAARLAEELGVSLTPVRDSLNRLVGERLVQANPGAGYQVPRLDETELRELIEWHHTLVREAVSLQPNSLIPIRLPRGHNGLPERVAALFGAIASVAGCAELDWALGNAAARLGQFRRHEREVLTEVAEEIVRIEHAAAKTDHNELIELLAAYHRRRRENASQLVRAARSKH